MIIRNIELTASNSFFLFGARGTGKSTLLHQRFSEPKAAFFDLLDADIQQTFQLRPQALEERLRALPDTVEWIILDEIQKIPGLLDVVHREIERGRFKFALTGSSARKLKRGAANLLAGRAFVYHLFPLTHSEIGAGFDIENVLQWGSLPKIFSLSSDSDKRDFLRGYTHTYLQEEISQEQLVRNLAPFHRFLAVAAQISGQIINFAKIGRDCGVSTVTVQTYFQILEETLLGIQLQPFHESVRKRQRGNPKFYFFDTGILRSLQNRLTVNIAPGTFDYGILFEHFVITEIFRLSSYARNDFQFSYLRTQAGVEIDLVIERPGRPRALIEIKSTDRISPEDVRALHHLSKDIPNSECFCLSRDPNPSILHEVRCLPWKQGLLELGLVAG